MILKLIRKLKAILSLSSRSNKRGLNISSSSVGSSCSYYAPISKRLKFLKHDTTVCSENCDTSMESSMCSINTTQMNSTQMLIELEEGGGANNNEEEEEVEVKVCTSCTDLSPSVAECLSCPEETNLCQLCLAAHRRVRITRDHEIKVIKGEKETQETAEVTLLKTFQCLVDLVKMTRRLQCVDLDSAIDSCIAEALKFKNENPDVKLRPKDEKIMQELLSIELLPLFHENSLKIHVRILKVLQAVFECEWTVTDPAILVTEAGLEAYSVLLSSNSDNILLTLDCMSTIVTLLAAKQMRYQVMILQQKLKPILVELQDSERDYVINVKFRASKLSRQLTKALV